MYLGFTPEEMRNILIKNGYIAKGNTTVKKDGVSYLIEDAFHIFAISILSSGGGLQFSGLKKITVGKTQPINPSVGDLWFRENN
jgi:hypothetical protein